MSPKLGSVSEQNQQELVAVKDRKTNFSATTYSRISTNPENLAKICPVDVEIIGLTFWRVGTLGPKAGLKCHSMEQLLPKPVGNQNSNSSLRQAVFGSQRKLCHSSGNGVINIAPQRAPYWETVFVGFFSAPRLLTQGLPLFLPALVTPDQQTDDTVVETYM